MKKFEFRLNSITAKLDLSMLGSNIIPVITPEAAGFYRENCMVCFHNRGHKSGIRLKVFDHREEENLFEVCWPGNVTPQLIRNHSIRQATDHAACAIALMLLVELTEYTAIEMASIGTTVDYYLTPQNSDDDFLIFNHSARLEVSGILEESKDNTVGGRIRDKINRLKPDPSGSMPTYIIVVEFSTPWAKMVES